MIESAPQETCIFCKLTSGRLPASVVYKDDDWLAFMDIHPIRQGHVLILPIRHVARLHELDRTSQTKLFTLADAIVRAQEASGFALGGSNLMLNDGIAANQHIPHLHLHCIPRQRGDTLGFGMRLLARTVGIFGSSKDRAELDAVAATLVQNLPPQV